MLSPEAWLREFRIKTNRLRRDLENTPGDAAEWGANEAARIAPKQTTTLVQAINFKTIGNSDKKTAMIYIRPIENPTGGRTTKYAAIMHRKGGKNVWHSGDRYFMFTTRKAVAKKFDTKVRFAVGRFLGKKPA